MDPPAFLQLEPVGQCNLRCRMCAIPYRQDGPPHGPLAFVDVALFERLLDESPSVRRLQLQGLGEPMLHPRFFELVERAVRRGIEVSTNSNLTVLDERRAERCVTSGLAELHVSIDGATAPTYEAIRRRARFERVLRNLGRLMETRARLASERPAVRIVFVAMRRNLAELADVVRLAHRFGVPSVFAQHLCHDFEESTLPERYRPMRRFVQDETLAGADPGAIEQAFAAARATAAALGVELRLPRITPRAHPPGTPGRARCDWPWRGLYLSYEGVAMPCCMVSTPDRVALGDARRAPLDAIWNGAAYRSFRERLDSDDPPEVCRSCALYAGTF
ncbi:MAG: radical SAM protein [Proteobacteria bacterium]|nr:MAG: radical SAM protein [Pseudomonadota bacterium]